MQPMLPVATRRSPLMRSSGRSRKLTLRGPGSAPGGAAVRLSAMALEPLVPGADPHAPRFRHGRLDMLGIADRFGTSAVPTSGLLASRPIPLPGVSAGDGPLVVKVVGTDAQGRRVAAWTQLDLPRDAGALPDESPPVP